MVDRILPTKVWTVSPIGLLVAAIALEAGVLHFGIDDLDEGYFVYQAVRVLHGQVPYRDFETLYSPGLLYVHAALFNVLGHPSLMAPRVLALLARGGLLLGMYATARSFLRNPWWAAAPGLLLLLGLDDAPVRWEPHPGWLSSCFAILAAWCLTHRPSTRWLAASGAAAAVAYAFKQNTGVFILLAILIWTRQKRPWAPLATFVALTLPWLIPLSLAVGDLRQLGVLIGAVNQSGLFATPEPTLFIPLAALGAGAWLVRGDPNPRLRWLLLAGTALFLTEFPRMDTLHLAWSAPLLLVLGAIALERAPRLIALVSVALTMALLAPTWTGRIAFLGQPMANAFGLLVPESTAADLSGVVRDIQQRTRPGEPIFVYPTSPLLYMLADRPNPSRFDHLNPGAANADQIQQVIADLQRSDVRLVVVSDFWEFAWDLPGTSANGVLESWLYARYSVVAHDGAYRVLAADL